MRRHVTFAQDVQNAPLMRFTTTHHLRGIEEEGIDGFWLRMRASFRVGPVGPLTFEARLYDSISGSILWLLNHKVFAFVLHCLTLSNVDVCVDVKH